MDARMVQCPSCRQTSPVFHWDKTTAEQLDTTEDKITSVGASYEQHAEEETKHRCPICNDEVDGVALSKADDQD